MTNLIKEIFPLLNFNPETKRYIAINAKNNPKGSDLNQPINPLVNIGSEMERINAANSPEVVQPKKRTKENQNDRQFGGRRSDSLHRSHRQ